MRGPDELKDRAAQVLETCLQWERLTLAEPSEEDRAAWAIWSGKWQRAMSDHFQACRAYQKAVDGEAQKIR